MKNLNIEQQVIPPVLHLINPPGLHQEILIHQQPAALHLNNQQVPRQNPSDHQSKNVVEEFCHSNQPSYDISFDWEELDTIEPADIYFEHQQLSCSSTRYYDPSLNMVRNTWEDVITTIEVEEEISTNAHQLRANSLYHQQPISLVDYTKKDKGKALKKKTQPTIDSFFKSKRKKVNQLDNHQPQPGPSHESPTRNEHQPHGEKSDFFCDDIILCNCNIPAVVNRVSCTDKHIENHGR